MDRLNEILALLENPDQISDEELGALETELQDLFDELRSGDDVANDDIIEALGQIADACDNIRAAAAIRIEAAETAAAEEEQRQAERAAALEELEGRVHAQVEEPEPEEPAEEPEPEEPEAEVEPEPEPEVVEEPEPVPASTKSTPLSRLSKSVPKKFHAQPKRKSEGYRIVARGTGVEYDSKSSVEDELLSRFGNVQGVQLDPSFAGKIPLAQFQFDYPDSHSLPEGRVTDVNDIVNEIREAAFSEDTSHMQSLMADGGICATPTPIYTLQTISTAQRPLRASVTTVNAPRGGITWDSPIHIADILVDGGATTGAIGSMTEAQDDAGATNKTYQQMPCGTPQTVLVDILWRQLGFGVLTARTNPERAAQFTDLSLARFARYAEQRLWTKMLALCTHLNAPQKLGATRDFLTTINQTAINFRRYHRMPKEALLEIRLPAWIGEGLLPDDQVNALQSYPEQFEVTPAWVEARLAQRNIRVAAWYEDDWVTAPANEGGINPYPSTFKVILTHPGFFAVVDNGTLDLGLFRDGTMINDNVFRTFVEEFWNLAGWGVDAWDIEYSLCANGASAGSVEPTCGS